MKRLIFGLIFLTLLATVFAALPEVTQVNYTPSPAIPGTTITVLVQIENNDATTKKDVTIIVEDSYPFIVKETSEQNVGDLEKYGKALAEFTIYVDPSAENTTYDLSITVNEGGQELGIKKAFPIIISGKNPTLTVLNTSIEQLIPGQEEEITFTIKNVGTSTAYDVLVELQEDRTIVTTGTIVEREIIPIGAATAYISSIAPGEEKAATLKISVNREAELKNYTLPVKMNYRDSSGTRTTDTSYIGLKIFGTVNIDATIKEITKINGLSEMTIEIFNKGSGKAEYMTAEILADGYIDKPKQFIGSLEPNDVDSIKTKIENPNQKITLTLSYQDTDAIVKTKTITLDAKSAPISGEEGNIFGLIIPLIIIAVVIWFGYNKFIKKK